MKTFLTAAALILAAGTTQATTITVNETAAPGGDYANALGAAGNNLGVAPHGTTNVNIHGDLRCAISLCSGGLDDVFDAFYFDVAANTTLTSLQLDVSPSTPLSTLEFTAQLIDTSNSSILFNTTFGAPGSVTSVTLLGRGDAPIGPGNYNFALFFTNLPNDNVGTVNYTLSSHILDTTPSPVPLPAAMPFLLVGLGGLAMVGRRRKREAA